MFIPLLNVGSSLCKPQLKVTALYLEFLQGVTTWPAVVVVAPRLCCVFAEEGLMCWVTLEVTATVSRAAAPGLVWVSPGSCRERLWMLNPGTCNGTAGPAVLGTVCAYTGIPWGTGT